MIKNCPHIKILFYLFAFAGAKIATAQHHHFSQLNGSWMLQNPAATADLFGDMAAWVKYRRQWAAIPKGYRTNVATYEMSLFREKGNTNYLGVGGYIVSDKAGKSQLQTFVLSGNAAYHFSAGREDRFSMGLSMGFIQRSIRPDGLAWDAQYNGIAYDASADNRETFMNQSRSAVDASFGMMWWHSAKDEWKLGYSIGHLLQQRTHLANGNDKLDRLHTLNFMYKHKLPFLLLRYDLRLMRTARAMEIMPGAMAEYRIGRDSRYTGALTSSAAFAGCYYRFRDALVPTLGFEWERSLSLFISYDISLSSVNRATGVAGGPEITLRYEGRKNVGVAKLSEKQ